MRGTFLKVTVRRQCWVLVLSAWCVLAFAEDTTDTNTETAAGSGLLQARQNSETAADLDDNPATAAEELAASEQVGGEADDQSEVQDFSGVMPGEQTAVPTTGFGGQTIEQSTDELGTGELEFQQQNEPVLVGPDVSAYQFYITDLESRHGAFANGLSEQLLGLGTAYQEQGLHKLAAVRVAALPCFL